MAHANLLMYEKANCVNIPTMRFSIACCLLFLVFPGPAHAEPLHVGAATIDITPPIGYPLWGYAARRDQPSTGVHDPLHARALVLAVGKSKLAIVSLDLGRAPTRQSMARIRQQVSD